MPSRRGIQSVPAHVVLPEAMTGVAAPIIVVLGDRFPMIHAHKVLPAYACLVSRLVTGRFDPTRHRALWPSTGNYCRGGVAISRTVGCPRRGHPARGHERRALQLAQALGHSPDSDIVRTPGTESNVREIYEACERLSARPGQRGAQPVQRVRQLPGALQRHRAGGGARVQAVQAQQPGLKLAAFVSASGSAGTLGAGDWLKEQASARRSWRSRRWSARPCSTTALANTTSRASATSTFR
jgi:cysteine synthase A